MPHDVSKAGESQPRFLFYSHDGLGLGHTRRNLAIAAALTERCPNASVLIASGTDEIYRMGLPARVEVLKLPGLRKVRNEEYAARRLGINSDEIRELRAALLDAAVRSFRPSVVLLDKHPFGARGEFRAGLQMVREYGGRCVLGLRDILDDPATVRREWTEHQLPQRIADVHDRILIYGEKAVFDPLTEYALPESLHARARFCGYVMNEEAAMMETPGAVPFWGDAADARPIVLATTGGGEDGFRLLRNFIDAIAHSPWRGVVVTGPMMAQAELEILRQKAAEARVVLHSFVAHLPMLFRQVDAMVCMGGYNTLTEAVGMGVPTVCIPRVQPRTEQLIRSQAFERLGLLQSLEPDAVNRLSLRAAIAVALQTSPQEIRARAQARLRFDGAQQAAEELIALAQGTEIPASVEARLAAPR